VRALTESIRVATQSDNAADKSAPSGWYYMDSRPSRRTENRTRLEVPITLVSLDLATYEVTTTQDVSLHGACVLTKQHWTPNRRIDVRSLRGSFNGLARVVHCQQRKGATFVMGLEFFFTDGDWKLERGPSAAATG